MSDEQRDSRLKLKSVAAAQKVELKAETVVHVGKVDAAVYPLAKKKTSYEFLREKAHLRPRTNTIGAISNSAKAVGQQSDLARRCAKLRARVGRWLPDAVHYWLGQTFAATHTQHSGHLIKVLSSIARDCIHS